jgi:hypothetical protein
MTFEDLARATLAERSNYIVAAADKLGVSELIIENSGLGISSESATGPRASKGPRRPPASMAFDRTPARC